MNNYLSLVGRGTEDFKDVFRPGSEMLVEDAGVVTLAGFVGESKCLQWRIWIPPGFKGLQATVYAFWGDPACKVLMRFGQPPVGGLDSVTPDNAAAVDLRNVLASLLAGAEIPCYSPEKSGGLKLSDGSLDSPVLPTTGGWLYIKALQMPGERIAQLDVRVTADAGLYKQWYAQVVWDEQGNPVPGVATEPPAPAPVDEKAVLKRVNDTGLAAALMELSGAKTDQELTQRALATGTWAALLRFAANT